MTLMSQKEACLDEVAWQEAALCAHDGDDSFILMCESASTH